MLPPSLIQYLQRCFKAEIPFDTIKPQLAQMNWSKEQISEAEHWYNQASQDQVDAPPLTPIKTSNQTGTFNSIEQVIPKRHLDSESFENDNSEPEVSKNSGSFFYKTIALGINILTILFFLAAIGVVTIFLIISGTLPVVSAQQQKELGDFVMEAVPGLP
ncbi:hypothetical protein GYA49_03215 [Candidatus Beckwithbacteria bacterium]|nr:hypothetical protein [Candidatus Beckwithbacteria bacterium]